MWVAAEDRNSCIRVMLLLLYHLKNTAIVIFALNKKAYIDDFSVFVNNDTNTDSKVGGVKAKVPSCRHMRQTPEMDISRLQ